MRRTHQSLVEAIEPRSLLSGGPSGLVTSIVAMPTTTSTGTTVALTFTETNVSDHAIQVDIAGFNSGFTVKESGKVVWVSNTGPLPQNISLEPIEPGKSFHLTATWDGHSNSGEEGGPSVEGPALKGVFAIYNQIDPEATTTVAIGLPATHVVPPRPSHRFP